MPRKKTALQLKKENDKRIDLAYRATCCGIQVNMLDIPKIFQRGHELIATGADQQGLESGIKSYVESIRVG